MLHWGMLDAVGDQLASAIVDERAAAATPAPAETRKRTKKAMQMDGASSSAPGVSAESSVVLLDALLVRGGRALQVGVDSRSWSARACARGMLAICALCSPTRRPWRSC